MVQFMVVSIIMQIFIGYALAIMLGTFCKGFKVFKTIFFIPVVIPLTATALLWRFLYMPGDTGVLNYLMNLIGLGNFTTLWLVDSKTVLNSIIVANSWTGLGYHMIIGFAAISSIPTEIIEASEIDGATGLRKITNIIIPMIWEALRVSMVLIIIGSVKIFDIIYIMTKGGPDNITQVPATLLYFEAFQYDNYGFGSAISVFILVTSIILAIVSLKLTQKDKIEY